MSTQSGRAGMSRDSRAVELRQGDAVHHQERIRLNPGGPGLQEIEAVGESGELTDPEGAITVPPEAIQVGHRYRVRVRFRDVTGRWSHWSDPLVFEPS